MNKGQLKRQRKNAAKRAEAAQREAALHRSVMERWVVLHSDWMVEFSERAKKDPDTP